MRKDKLQGLEFINLWLRKIIFICNLKKNRIKGISFLFDITTSFTGLHSAENVWSIGWVFHLTRTDRHAWRVLERVYARKTQWWSWSRVPCFSLGLLQPKGFQVTRFFSEIGTPIQSTLWSIIHACTCIRRIHSFAVSFSLAKRCFQN